MINFDQINERALPYAEEIFDEIGLDSEVNGNEYVCINPNREEDSSLGSFKFNLDTGAWADFATMEDDAKGVGVISYVKYVKGCTLKESATMLKKWLDKREQLPAIDNAPAKRKAAAPEDNLTIVQPITADAPKPEFWFGEKLGKPSMGFVYKDASGNVLGYILRFDLADGNKEIRPYTLWKDEAGNLLWKLKGFPVPRPLYNLHLLAAQPDAPVLVVEGEKSANAAMKLFPHHVVTSVMGGANAVDKADLNPLIGRDVSIWPDYDEAGRKYAKDIASSLLTQDSDAKIMIMEPLRFDPEITNNGTLKSRSFNISEGEDAADAVENGWTAELIRLLPSDTFVEFRIEKLNVQQQPSTKEKEKLTKKDHVQNIVAMFGGYLNYVNLEPYSYKDGHWPMLDERVEVEQLIAHYLGNKVSSSGINELLKLVQVFQAKSEQAVAPDLNLICLLNGTLDTRTGALIEHSPDHNLKCQINSIWDADAPCERWLKFLDEIFVNDPDKTDKIQLLQEWFGYCVTPDNSFHKFLWMVGRGGNGKSVILDILEFLVGSRNVSNAHIERLADKGVRAELENKLVNFSAEMGSEATVEDGYLKTIVSGDVIEAERKYKPSFSFRPYVRLVGSTNHLPRLLDLSDGFFRRAIILTFNRQFSDAERIPKLAEKMAAAELPGILAWAVRGLKNLHERGYFVIPESSVEALNQYKLDSDPDRLFFEECLVADPHGQGMSPNEIYEGYSTWCIASGYRAKAKNNFGKRLPDFGIDHYRGHSGKRWLVKPNPASIEYWHDSDFYWNPPTAPSATLAATPAGLRL